MPKITTKNSRLSQRVENFMWADATYPYIKSRQIFHCPQAPTKPTSLPQSRGYTSYYFNARLSARNQDANNANQLVLSGEGDDGLDFNNARYSKSNWPLAWEKSRKSPLFRHLTEQVWATRGSYTLFADGHAKLLSPMDFTRGHFTFQPH